MWWTLDAEVVIIFSVRIWDVGVVVAAVVLLLVRDWRGR